MVDYFYRPQPAIDADGTRIAEEGTGSVYAISDTTFSTPLSVTLAGDVVSTIVGVSALGQTAGFTVADHPEVNLKSGDFISPLVAWSSVVADAAATRLAAEQAVAAAELARDAAQAAQDAVAAAPIAIPTGGVTGQALVKASGTDRDVTWATVSGGTGGGVTSHGALSNLGLDDHPQYHNDARGDARYYRKAEVEVTIDNKLASKSIDDRKRGLHTGTQPISSVEGLQAALDAAGGGSTGPITAADITDATTTGRNVLKATSQASARTAIAAAASSDLAAKANVTHTHTTAQVTGFSAAVEAEVATVASQLGDEAVARTVYGSSEGQILQPWGGAPLVGPQYWDTPYFRTTGGANNTTVETFPNMAPNTEYTTHMGMPNLGNGDTAFRFEFDYDMATTAWAQVQIGMIGPTGVWEQIAEPLNQDMMPSVGGVRTGSGHMIYEFQPAPGENSGMIKVRVVHLNNGTGTFSVTNLSVREIGHLAHPLAFGTDPGDSTTKDIRLYLENSQAVQKRFVVHEKGGIGYSGIRAQADWETTAGGEELRLTNNDQILEVWNGSDWEYRGNVHGGETVRAGAGNDAHYADYGDGVWHLLDDVDYGTRFDKPARRMKHVWNTQIALSTGAVFANVDHTTVTFDDGVMRTDRTTTFLLETQAIQYFDWMSSHDTNNATNWTGRLGKGQQVIDRCAIGTPAARPPVGKGSTAMASDAMWSVWHMPVTGVCFGHIYDRDSALSRPDVAAVKSRIGAGAGIIKQYTNWFSNSDRLVFPAGTVIPATHWAVLYVPEDVENYHERIADLAANLGALKSMYPAT